MATYELITTGFIRLVSDPETVQVGDSLKVLVRGVYNENRKQKNTQEVIKVPHFFDFEAWDTAAEYIVDNYSKGDVMWVKAKPRNETWETADGQKRRKDTYRLLEFEKVERKSNQSHE